MKKMKEMSPAEKRIATTKKKYGEDYYHKVGSIGGKARKTLRGFQDDPERAKTAGALGGSISRRGPAKPKEEVEQ